MAAAVITVATAAAMAAITATVAMAAAAAIAATAIAGYFWHRYYAAKERQLLYRLEQMVRDARQGRFCRSEISENEISALENDFQLFLDDSLKSEKDQQRQKDLVQELISDIAHQTLTPVANLKLYAQLLKEADTGHAPLTDTLAGQADKLDFLIQSLVKLSRMEQGMIKVRPVSAPLGELLKAIGRDYQQQAAEKGIFLKTADVSLWAAFDRKWTAEAVGNLVDNAIKYTPKGGLVEISARRYSFFVCIDIRDTGIGIREEEIPKIFGRFYRGMAVEDEPGAGIGLFLAREIIRAQKGYIKVSSKPGEGSVFSVFLPFFI